MKSFEEKIQIFDGILNGEEINKYINTHYPNESDYKKSAFKNSVATAVTGISGGFGGPSIREYASPKQIENLEEAFEKCSKVCFHELTEKHLFFYKNRFDGYPSFNNDPEDLEKLKEMI